jgi:murein DD-endopeptidase MepM/ murein hydrolase activator NlpD
VIKRVLIAFILFFAVNSIELSAQNNMYEFDSTFLANYGQPGSVGTYQPVKSRMTNTPSREGSAYKSSSVASSNNTDLLYPQPYIDFKLNLLLEKDPLPPYYSVEGLYKIDCVYISGFDYYKLWETNKLNPYGFNGEHYMDSVELILYKEETLGNWHSPLDKTIVTSDFGLRRAVWHYGIDIRVKTGNPVYAAFDGVIRISGYDRRGFGRFIVIRHKNGLETLYAHLSKNLKKLGEEVKAGDIIGKGGNSGRSTAPHLHFELRYSGNAIDPNQIFDFKENKIISSTYIINHNTFAYLEEANKIRYHVIRSGDTLSGLSYRYGVSISKMCSLSGISRNSILRIGQRVRIN